MSWGEPGTDPGQFNIVHNICTDADGWVYVADRENHRIQVFDGNGKYETQWNNLHRPCGLYMTTPAIPSAISANWGRCSRSTATARTSGRGSASSTTRASCCRALATCMPARRRPRFSGRTGSRVDSRGDLYVGEVSWTQWPQFFPDTPRPAYIRSLQKYERVR